MIIKKSFNFAIYLIGIFLMISLVSATYSRSTNPNYGLFESYDSEKSIQFDKSVCQEGKDFVLQISPFGCTPAVVRSDLLEEQNVPIFCQIGATQVNPLIDVQAIDSVSFSDKDFSREIMQRL